MTELVDNRSSRHSRTPYRTLSLALRRLFKNRSATIGLIVVLLFALVGIFADVLAPMDPFAIDAFPLLEPSLAHPMGTDNLGRDILSQFILGARATLWVAFTAVLLSTLIGVPVGLIAGYVGGTLDDAIMRATEFFQVIPRFLLAIVLVAIAGSSMWTLILVVGGLSWPLMARVVRSEVLALREYEFVEAARAIGVGSVYIMIFEILPNATTPVIVNASLQVSQAILLVAGLNFIGLGDPDNISWGTMLYSAQSFLRHAWWMSVFPGAGIALVVWGLNVLGDGLNEVMNPRHDAA